MRRIGLFLGVCVAASGVAAAAQAGNSTKPNYSKQPFVTEQVKARFRFENDGRGREEQVLRVRVQSEAGVQRWGQLRFGYNAASESFEIPYVRVMKQDGSVVTAGADAVQELSEPVQRIAPVYTDYREKHVTVPGLRPGDVLECETVTVIHTPLAPGQFWMQYDFHENDVVLDEQLEIDLPAARTVKLKTRPGMEPKITEEKGRRIYRWSSSHLVTEDEDNSDDKGKKKKTKKRSEDESPAVQLTSFASWEEVGLWYGGLEKDRRVPSKVVRAKAQELSKGLTTDIEKIEALYDYTAKDFRYVSLSLGMGRYQPHSADEVLRNQYGDCKDKHTLLASLLEAEGIHASSVLINPARKLDPDVPSPAQFNHVITMVPLGKDELWMDTTTEVAPFRLLAFSLRKKQALVIPPNGVPHLEETPADSPIPDTEKLQIDGKVDDSGKLEAKIAYEIRGDSEILMRRAFRGVASSQWQQIIETTSAKEGLGKEVSEVKISDPAATREPFTFSYRVATAGYVDQSKKKLELKLPLAVLGLVGADPDDADSPDPIKLGPPNTRDYRIRIEFPSKYSLHAPVPFSLKRDYGSYDAEYKLEGNVLTAERKLTVSESELPTSRVQDYLAFRRNVVADLAQALSLETTVAESSESSTSTKPEDLLRRGNAERRNGNYSLAIDLLNRAVEADPKSKSAWNDLGLAYLDSRQDGLAINAFQKQLEVNPYDAYAYNNLGRVFLWQRKYEEATKSFNKQIEIDPLDKFAHANLGTVYLEQHKYAEAVPELERAASLTPDNAGSQVRLGEAYLNLAQDEKAMAAFDKAVKIAATPGIWNNIAYQLTLKKAHLDLAQRYAESAVTTTAAALRNLSLDRLTPRNLGLTEGLGDYWDTLGWVEFADGSLDKAEKYDLGAWLLCQHSEVADHLGQIYEKRGDKERAIHYYALAMNARRPEPETQGRLAALAGADKVDAMVEKSQKELIEQRTIRLGNAPKQVGKAEFFVLLANGPGSGMSVEEVKFANGDANLKAFTDALRTARYSQTLPDETAVKILRRGTLSCADAASDCTFVLVLPEDVKSVD
jgi:Flp pilus assembly protein TadD